jgi:hypothetical protein
MLVRNGDSRRSADRTRVAATRSGAEPRSGPLSGSNLRRIPGRTPCDSDWACSWPRLGSCTNAGKIPPSRGGNVPRLRVAVALGRLVQPQPQPETLAAGALARGRPDERAAGRAGSRTRGRPDARAAGRAGAGAGPVVVSKAVRVCRDRRRTRLWPGDRAKSRSRPPAEDSNPDLAPLRQRTRARGAARLGTVNPPNGWPPTDLRDGVFDAARRRRQHQRVWLRIIARSAPPVPERPPVGPAPRQRDRHGGAAQPPRRQRRCTKNGVSRAEASSGWRVTVAADGRGSRRRSITNRELASASV